MADHVLRTAFGLQLASKDVVTSELAEGLTLLEHPDIVIGAASHLRAAIDGLDAIRSRLPESSRVGVLVIPVQSSMWDFKPDVRKLANERISFHYSHSDDVFGAAVQYLRQFLSDLTEAEQQMDAFTSKPTSES